jgi:hypothetical protein
MGAGSSSQHWMDWIGFDFQQDSRSLEFFKHLLMTFGNNFWRKPAGNEAIL